MTTEEAYAACRLVWLKELARRAIRARRRGDHATAVRILRELDAAMADTDDPLLRALAALPIEDA